MLSPQLLEPCPTLPFVDTPPTLSEQQRVLFPSNFGALVSLLQRGGGGHVTLQAVGGFFNFHFNIHAHLDQIFLCYFEPPLSA